MTVREAASRLKIGKTALYDALAQKTGSPRKQKPEFVVCPTYRTKNHKPCADLLLSAKRRAALFVR